MGRHERRSRTLLTTSRLLAVAATITEGDEIKQTSQPRSIRLDEGPSVTNFFKAALHSFVMPAQGMRFDITQCRRPCFRPSGMGTHAGCISAVERNDSVSFMSNGDFFCGQRKPTKGTLRVGGVKRRRSSGAKEVKRFWNYRNSRMFSGIRSCDCNS